MAIDTLPAITKERKNVLLCFERQIGIKFKSLPLLNLAFVHRSALNETAQTQNNERLEFLGDAILGAATATLLYEKLTGNAEGDLAKIKSIVVSEEVLSGVARELMIGNMMIMGHGEEVSGGREKKGLLADTLEALFGALYLDGGYKTAFAFISRVIKPEIERVLEKKGFQDFKSRLQEICQKQFKTYPVYNLIRRIGPEHEKYFWVEVCFDGKKFGPAMGKAKKIAEQAAARMALESMRWL